MRYLFLAALLLSVSSPVLAEGKDDGPTPQQLNQEFLGYAQEYRDEAKELSSKAAATSDAHEAGLLGQLADLSLQLAGLKERMAKGYLNNDDKTVDQAEAAYYKLRSKEDALWESMKEK